MGMAGMASALFAAERGFRTVQIGAPGEMVLSSGLLDLMGSPTNSGEERVTDPWANIEAVVRKSPKHPYSHLDRKTIESAFDRLLSFLDRGEMPYVGEKERNVSVLTPLGKIKDTYYVPLSMWNGVKALRDKSPCLLVDFESFNDFSAKQIEAVQKKDWPRLRSVRVPFPGKMGCNELYSGEMMALALEMSQNLKELIHYVKPFVKDAQYVGLPAVLGMSQTKRIMHEMEENMGVPVFEIPTLPSSVPGLRLNETFKNGLSKLGVERIFQQKVLSVNREKGEFFLKIGHQNRQKTIFAKGVILATGRFWGGGLAADRRKIRETVFSLPVYQPAGRDKWHSRYFFEDRGHPVNRAGVETDRFFRPLNASGNPANQDLFAAGSVLAHQDWMCMKCGAGLSIATAFAAITAFQEAQEKIADAA